VVPARFLPALPTSLLLLVRSLSSSLRFHASSWISMPFFIRFSLLLDNVPPGITDPFYRGVGGFHLFPHSLLFFVCLRSHRPFRLLPVFTVSVGGISTNSVSGLAGSGANGQVSIEYCKQSLIFLFLL
jgi:hypothetical protein